uniref:Purple acid phosphatase n=1 Tax=Thraustotheca clavata TaxID=74557 RepID=A0A0A7CLF5_9STRA|nr:secreted protein [Thraustotheca clavata]
MQISKCLAGLSFLSVVAAKVTQVHVGLSGEAVNCKDGVSVTFASDSAAPLQVQYGASSTDQVATTTVNTYKVENPKYKYQSPNLHTAKLCNLKPNTNYSYKVQEYIGTFKTIPAANKKTVLSVVGDVGIEEIQKTITNLGSELKGTTPDAVIIAGDWAYANGCHEDWDKWLEATQPLFSKTPLLGITGNHEIIEGDGVKYDRPECVAEMYSAYSNRIITPITDDANKDHRTWYSKNIGNIHAVFLDDYTGILGEGNIGSDYWKQHRQAQVDWLSSDLAAVNRADTPYVIVFKHNPYYNSWGKHQCQCSPVKFEIDNSEACWYGNYYMNSTSNGGKLGDVRDEPHCANQAKFEDLYQKYNVDAVMAGHVHAYERTAPIYKNKATEGAATYFTVGTGGHGLYQGAISPMPTWSRATSSSLYGASRVVADNDKLTIYFRANGETNNVFDSVEIPRRTKPSFLKNWFVLKKTSGIIYT